MELNEYIMYKSQCLILTNIILSALDCFLVFTGKKYAQLVSENEIMF